MAGPYPPLHYLAQLNREQSLPSFATGLGQVMPPPRSQTPDYMREQVPPDPAFAGLSYQPGAAPLPPDKPQEFSFDRPERSPALRGDLATMMEGWGVPRRTADALAGSTDEGGMLPLASLVPVLGGVLAASDIKQNLKQGEYGAAALNALGLVPGGVVAAKTLRNLGRAAPPLATLAGGAAATLSPDDAEAAWKLPYRAGKSPGSLWHDISKTKLDRPFEEFSPLHGPRDPAMAEAPQITPASLQGEHVIPLAGDRSLTGVPLLGVGGKRFETPVNTYGGPYFGLRNAPHGWASEQTAAQAVQNKVDAVAEKTGKAPLLSYTAMGPRSGDYNTMTTEAIREAMRKPDASAADIRAFDKEMRRQLGGKDSFPGVQSMDDDWIRNAKGDRKRLAEEMALAHWQDRGFPSIAELRHGLTEPELLHAPDMSTGFMFLRSQPGAKLERGGPDQHPTYGSKIPATVVGQLPGPAPWDVMYRDQAAKIAAQEAARGEKATGPQIQRSLQMGLPVQRVDEQLVRALEDYLGGGR